MKGRKCKEAPSTDLLVCFPSRAHLTLMSSPATHHHHLKRSNTRGIGPAGQASPMLWAKSKRIEISEPTSPKVTCAGQIKVRTKPKSCKIKNWQSVMEEIEKLHVKKHKKKKKPVWMEAVGFKKDAMQFLTCLRNIRFDFRCFGSFNSDETDIITSDDDQEDEEFQDNENEEVSRTVFSKWFMVLQENQKTEYTKTEETEYSVSEDNNDGPSFAPPPPNALLLMRCRSAPTKSLLEQKHDNEYDDDDERKNEKSRMEELESSEKNKKKSLVVMRYGSDLYKNPFSRSRSSKM